MAVRQVAKTTGKHHRLSSTSSVVAASASQWKSNTQVVSLHHVYTDNAAWAATGEGNAAVRARKQSLANLLDTSVDSKTSLRLRKISSPNNYAKTAKSNKKMPSATCKKLESSFKV